MSVGMELMGMKECMQCGDAYTVTEDDTGVCGGCIASLKYAEGMSALRAELATLKAAHAEELRAVAERQREACAMEVVAFSSAAKRFTVEVDDARDAVLATPLVTEDK
jgi:hypothetical protein